MPSPHPDLSLPARVMHFFASSAAHHTSRWNWYSTPGSDARAPRWRLARGEHAGALANTAL